MPDERARGPIVRWQGNGLRDVTPPADASEWVSIVREICPILLVRFVSNERGGWRVAKATAHPGDTGPLIDRSAEAKEALRDAGKPVVD